MQTESERVQARLTAYLRDPEHCPAPEGVETRRLELYRDLIYRNLESFLLSAFPLLRALTPDRRWQRWVRAFLRDYRCQSPYFLTISEEFVQFLGSRWRAEDDDYPFVPELAHYEWVELALTVAEDDLTDRIDGAGDLLAGVPVLANNAWPLAYRFPVHRIGLDYRPQQPPAEPSYLIAYRRAHEPVRFMSINAVTARLLALMQTHPHASGEHLLGLIGRELAAAVPATLLSAGAQTLNDLRERGIILGTRLF